MARDGSGQPASPTTFAGTPATVTLFGTGLMTTEPAAIRAQWPTSIFPRNSGARADHDAAPDLRVTVLVLLAGTAERHIVQDRNVILDHRRLAHDKSRRMVEENAATDFRSRIDVALEYR